MKNTFLALLITFIAFTAFAQGSWDIGYIEIDSIRISDVGRTVKLDFRHTSNTLCAGKYEDLKKLNIQFQVNIAFKQN